MNNMNSVAVDAAGNLFIADTGNHRIRKVTPDGRIATIAGNGVWSTGCNTMAATVASAEWPFACAKWTNGPTAIRTDERARQERVVIRRSPLHVLRPESP